ncbi:MAG: bifunctional phosphoribosylaminoimidazolecarboxamide formyltransferase/IMP cyclohydrolase [Bacteroidales bacterium]|nr:bifunctional phosphoribosylaminoimidazolecarboxamide formyltransferase/IMP cyclohydrolase [Bacteroidales bacterium]
MNITIKNAIISVYDKTCIDDLLPLLKKLNVTIFATNGTLKYIKSKGYEAKDLHELTNFPPLFNGRVKTLHPLILGGILYKKDNSNDQLEAEKYNIPSFDLVVVDLYPFKETTKATSDLNEIIEKVDIGGITLIRAAAKNFFYTTVVAEASLIKELVDILSTHNGVISYEQREYFAKRAFEVTSLYDLAIFLYLNKLPYLDIKLYPHEKLRYGENPHQEGYFIGNLSEVLEKIQGKELSYNNILDIESAINLLAEFNDPTCVIIKHNNPCAVASNNEGGLSLWHKTLQCDPISSFGGIIATNVPISLDLAKEIDKIFFEILIAYEFADNVIEYFKKKPARILIKLKQLTKSTYTFKSIINGILIQSANNTTLNENELEIPTNAKPTTEDIENLIFSFKIAKHCKSNAIVITKDKQLIGAGFGQTSRIDATNIAIQKAKSMQFNTENAYLASDGFFPFTDCIELALNNGIKKIIQPGGSINDKKIIEYCNNNNIVMLLTKIRHFKH